MNTSIQHPGPNGNVQPPGDSSRSEPAFSALRNQGKPFGWSALLAGLLFLLFSAPLARADRQPTNCVGSGLGIFLFTSAPDVHVGDTLRYSVTVFNGTGVGPIVCNATAIRAFVVTPDGVSHPIVLSRTNLSNGQSDFYLDVVSYVVRAQDILPDGTVRATASNTGIIHQNDTDSAGGGFQGVNTEVNMPCVLITALCFGGVGENGLITFTGTVTNCGNNTLVGVTVTNFHDGGNFTVLFPTNLARGQMATFSGSFTPLNPCVPSTAILTVRATDEFTSTPRTVTNFVTITCQNTLTPGIQVAKLCPAGPVSPGQLLTFSGSVTNTGNVTLTNIVVVNNQPAANTTVFTLASLAPGAVASFTGSYLAPTNCSVTDTLTVTAASRCGVAVTSTVSATCPILTAPAIVVTAACPVTPVLPGGSLTYSGTVRNAGNITLTNVVVVSDRPAANTTVFTVASLAPGVIANFTSSVTVPASACSVTTTFSGTGRGLCATATVTNTVSTTCTVTTAPAIAVTLACPVVPASAGGLITYTGTVRNSGNVTLTNVFVVNNQLAPNTPVIGPITLAPGAIVSFTASFTAPAEACSVSSTVTATGNDNCTAALVANTASATCTLMSTPGIVVTQVCPLSPPVPGGLLTYSGTVSNSGNITLTNIVVLNNLSGATAVFTSATMAPGASASFTGSYLAPTNCSATSTSTATGRSVCGVAVASTASATCPVLTAPQIAVRVVCPVTPVLPGGILTYSGTVSNAGNITLTNVVVVSDRPAANTSVFTVTTLAPGAVTNFTSSVTVPANACSVTTTFSGTGRDICTLATVTNTVSTTCVGTTAPAIAVTLACPAVSPSMGSPITYSGTVRNSGNVTLTNVFVVNSQPAPNSPVIGPITLAPGAVVNFTTSFTAPIDACSVSSTVTATGSDNCSGGLVTNTASATCTLMSTPGIVVTQLCPASPGIPGGLLIFSGSVSNSGNITLTNVVVASNQPGVSMGGGFVSPAGLVGHWALDEASGSVASDSSGSGNNGNILNATRVAGQSGRALNFNGTSSYVDVPNAASMNFTGVITISAWIKPQSIQAAQNVLSHGYSTSPIRATFLHIYQGRYEVGSQVDGVSFIVAAPVPAGDIGTFVHLAGVYNGSTWTLYRNGVALATSASGTGSVMVSANWAIGARGGGGSQFFDGTIDDVRLYQRALDASEIRSLAGQVVITAPNPVFTAATLAPGASAAFTFTYPVPTNSSCSVTSTLTGSGFDKCTGIQVASAASSTCPLLTAPRITVTQICPVNPVIPGGLLTYSGTVSNAGNTTLTNIVVVNNQPAPNTVVLTLASLAPGATANFTGSYVTPDDCCVVSSTVRASGQDCTGATVTDTATSTCSLLTSPGLVVTKVCPPGVLRAGDLLTYSGMASNTGTITLINVTVVNSQSPGSPVLGPVTLAPGESFSYTASYIVPPDFCGTDTVTASGLSVCTFLPVTNSVTTTCPVITTPRIAVTKNCPLLPTPRGGLYIYTGTVSNPGTVTLVNVFVVDNQPSNNTPVIGPITLAPGASVNFSGSYIAPVDCCEVIDTVTARGQDRCTGSNVTTTATTFCALSTTPGITLVQACPPTPIPMGSVYSFSGYVTNTGDVVLTNLFVFGPQGTNTPLLGPIELAPGESEFYFGSYTVPFNTCSVSVTARGQNVCGGNVVSNITSCPVATTPQIAVTQNCPPGTAIQGSLVTYSGTVSNPGNITLTNVLVFSNQPTNNSPAFGPITLFPGASAPFTGSYIATGGSNPMTNSTIVTNAPGTITTNNTVTVTTNTVTPTFGTINPVSGALIDRFNVGSDLHGLMFADQDQQWGSTLFYATRHPASGPDRFVTVTAAGVVTDRFPLTSTNYDALTLAAPDVGYGSVNFYYIRRNNGGGSTFGVIKAAGASSSADLWVLAGTGFNALAFAEANLGYGANLFYSLRQDNAGVSIFGTVNPTPGGIATDRYPVGTNANFGSLVFVPGTVSTWGTAVFAYLRNDTNGSIIGTINPVTQVVTDRVSLGTNFLSALTFTATDVGFGPNLFYYLRPERTTLTTNTVTTFTTNTVTTFTTNTVVSFMTTNTVTATGVDICQAREVVATANCLVTVALAAQSAQPSPRLIGVRIMANGAVSLTCLTEPGKVHTVQFKNKMSDPIWTDLETIVGTGGHLPITDPTAAQQPTRFYRVIYKD